MKRLAYLFLLVTLIGPLCYLLTANLKAAPALTDFLPADTVVLVESENFARVWEGWQHSAIGSKLNSPGFPQILALLGVPDSQIAGFRAARSILHRVAGASFFSGLFSKKAVMALLATPPGQSLDSPALLNNWVLIVSSGSALPSQNQLIGFFGPLRSTRTLIYQGVPLVTFLFQSGQSVTFCQHRKLLICSLDSKSVQRCIDQSLNRMVQTRSGLQLNQGYQELRKRTGGQADFFLYADLEGLLRQWPTPPMAGVEEKGLLPHQLAVFHRADAGHDRLSIVARVRQEQLTALADRYQWAPPVEDPLGQRIAPETQLYFWTNWFSLKTLWHFGLEMCGNEVEELMSFLSERIYEETGKGIDEFFDVFGNRFGVFINEQQVPPQSAQSMACLYIDVHDQQQVDAMLKQLLAGLQVVNVVTGETEIVSVVMAGGLLTPAYALMDHHLILADSVDLIEQIQRQGGIHQGKEEQNIGPAREQTANFFLFIRTQSMAQRLISMLTLLPKEAASQAKILSPRNRLLIEHALIPLLMSMQDMKTSSLRGYAAGDEIRLEMDSTSGREGFRIFQP